MRNRFDLLNLQDAQIRLPAVVSKQWAIISAQIVRSALGRNRCVEHTAQGITIAWITRFSPTARIQLFASIDNLAITRLRKMLRQHLSFMEHPRHDDIVRVVDIKSDQMSGSVHRWAY